MAAAPASRIFRSQGRLKSFLRFQGEAQIVDGVLELATGRRLGGDGQASPITERHRVVIGPVFLIIIWRSSISRWRSE